MAAIAIGPCMFLAPIVFVLMLLAIPLWPVGIVLVAALWLVTAPCERLLRTFGVRRFDGATRRVGKWLRFIVAPWKLFDKPAGGPPIRRPEWRPAADSASLGPASSVEPPPQQDPPSQSEPRQQPPSK